MNITFEKNKDGKYEIKFTGRLDECNTIIEALESSVTDNRAVQNATSFMRRKLNEHVQKG